ncbi:glycerate kinase [Vespertiliibacter pulmonis]|uniref:Glycerate kinase n=1 Tax=Vespertiliibacter pulmonis TaxID=1443036 RepID=A0A3N4VT40_9PAST|nr:glycerate kinase [Vespertiliibacter pulmonis]QLB20309.1 glycerate kinase [Vespertiliibacter pulmonis]RPE86292.1 glycerate kinase [Vespertiliibacter pulmonis]
MNIVIAPDSFKESLNALEVALAIQEGFQRIFPQATYQLVPMADGGEGTVQSLVDATSGHLQKEVVIAPLANQVEAVFGLSGDKQTAFIEMAAASGLHLVPVEQRNPLKTTSYGTGELIKKALDLGVKKILLGIGGSATNDGGVGMLQALGAHFLTNKGEDVKFGGEHLSSISQIDLSQLDSRLAQVQIDVACDVTHQLCGEKGASAVFAPQKGATPEMVQILDRALEHFAEQVKLQYNLDIAHPSGAGAAGGMGAGLLLLPNVTLKSGVEMVVQATNLAEKIKNADWVITGEGRMDSQTIAGKTPIGVAKVAKQWSKPVIAIVGSVKADYSVVYEYGIDAVFPIIRQVENLDATLKSAKENIISTAENVARLCKLAAEKEGLIRNVK